MEPTTVRPEGTSNSRRAQRTLGSRPARRTSGSAVQGATAEAADGLVTSLVSKHSKAMLATARRYSLCADDANDAWHRSVEILLRRAPSLDPATAHSWLRTVVKHEALAVRAERTRFLGHDEYDPDAFAGGRDPVEGMERLERLAAAAEAMQRLKPNETEALLLLASGMSYREIGEAKGWSYTKVNRLLTEGRQAFRLRVEGIESGAECERWRTTLTRIADNEASPKELRAVEPHLSRCNGCKALLRSDREATRAMALVLPGLATATDLPEEVPHRLWGTVGRGLSDLLLAVGLRLQGVAEAAASTKVVAVAASTAAIAGGGVAIEHAAHRSDHNPKPAAAAKAELPPVHDLGESRSLGVFRAAGSPGSSTEQRAASGEPTHTQKSDPSPPRPQVGGEFDPLDSSPSPSTASAQPAAADGPAEPRVPTAAQPKPRNLTQAAPRHAASSPAATSSKPQPTPEFGP